VTLLLPLLGFLFVSLLVTAAAMALSPAAVGTIERRLGEFTGARPKEVAEDSGYERVMIESLKRIGAAAPHSSGSPVRCSASRCWPARF